MARYIDAEKLKGLLLLDQSGIKDALKYRTHLHPERRMEHKAYIDAIEYCVKQINEAPTADVAEVRHGKWTENKTEYFLYGCSLCGYRVDNEYNFCPECGARMDGDADD
jgi:lipopolysaccharide biosynthesis regulator YciM